MARQMNYPNSKELLTTPPPIVDSDVSARWKRTWKREVVMTVILPDDVVDTELYVKTTRGHIGIQMDPWMSCSWKRNWSSSHPPNTQTKEKMRKFRLQRTGRRMSLFRISGRSSYSLPDQTPGGAKTSSTSTTTPEGHHLLPSQLSGGTTNLHPLSCSGQGNQKEIGKTPLTVLLRQLPTMNSHLLLQNMSSQHSCHLSPLLTMKGDCPQQTTSPSHQSIVLQDILMRKKTLNWTQNLTST